MIYLDNASSTRLRPEVRAAMAPWLDGEGGNASSPHAAGRRARKAVEDARVTVAACLGADPKEIIFTSGATESNNLAIGGVAEALRSKGDHVVTTAIEHPSVLEACARLERSGFRVSRVPVDGHGRVDPGDVRRAMTPRTVLVSVIWANNEVGTVQPIAEIREAAGDVLLHSDAAQAVGKVPVAVSDVDLLTLSAHKVHGPQGVGALRVRTGAPLSAQSVGGGQEFERRAGTEPVAAIVGLAEAVRLSVEALPDASRRMEELRARLHRGLGAPRILGHPTSRTPHLLNVAFADVDAGALILALDAEGVCVSSGSACASMSTEPSHVLAAMGIDPGGARGSVRFSLSGLTTAQEIDAAVAAVSGVVERVRRVSAAAR